jgi:hypothetical protein
MSVPECLVCYEKRVWRPVAPEASLEGKMYLDGSMCPSDAGAGNDLSEPNRGLRALSNEASA